MNHAAFNKGPDTHLLDHIGPLSSLYKMPLFIEGEKNFLLAKRYYPDLDAQYSPDMEYQLKNFSEKFDRFYDCIPWPSQVQKLIFDLYRKKVEMFYCCHGQSDKGYVHPLFRHFTSQDGILIYGDLLKDMLSELSVPTNFIKVGNFRLEYYEKHKKFYDLLIQNEFFSSFPKNNKTLLYAPTWNDFDQSSSFFHLAKDLAENLPSEYNLIVKVHPLLEEREPGRYYYFANLLEKRKNTTLISECPLIYPILNRIDFFLGDYSSVGYDFLYFQKPMFFFRQSHLPKGRLHHVGTQVESTKDLLQKLKNPRNLEREQKKLYDYAFQSLLGGRTNTVRSELKSSIFGHTSIAYV